MEQNDLNEALLALVDGSDPERWQEVVEALRDGSVVVEYGTNITSLRVVSRPAYEAFAARLRDLRAESSITQAELAQLMGISTSAVIRQLRGQTLSQWPIVRMMIQELGGDADDFRADYLAAKGRRKPAP